MQTTEGEGQPDQGGRVEDGDPIRRPRRRPGWDVVSKAPFADPRLSWKAKGLWGYLTTRPDDWDVFVGQLAGVSRDGRDSTRSALDELIGVGLVVRVEQRAGGRFAGFDYRVQDLLDPTDPAGAEYLAAVQAARRERGGTRNHTASGFSGAGETASGETGAGEPEANKGKTGSKGRKEGKKEEEAGEGSPGGSPSETPSRMKGARVTSVADDPPTVEVVQAYFREKGAKASDAKAFHARHTTTGWTWRGEPIRDWRGLADGWLARAAAAKGGGAGGDGGPGLKKVRPTFERDEAIRYWEARRWSSDQTFDQFFLPVVMPGRRPKPANYEAGPGERIAFELRAGVRMKAADGSQVVS